MEDAGLASSLTPDPDPDPGAVLGAEEGEAEVEGRLGWDPEPMTGVSGACE